jgi:hypothetical protein
VATYFVEIGKLLSGVSADNDDGEDKGEKLIRICHKLKMSEAQLKLCEHNMDITKTCRQIVKYIYPDVNERAQMLVSAMNDDVLQAVQGIISKYYLSITDFYFSRVRKNGPSCSSKNGKFDPQQCYWERFC